MLGKPLAPGSQLGRYELLTPIAQGGMATVWAARQSGSHGFRKTVALKVTLPTLSEDPQFERMFLSEGRLAMRVHHPNVVETLDLGEEDGLVYLVMEWVDGESLSTLLKASERASEPLSIPIAIHICARAARGLHAAHTVVDDDERPAGIVHRDVSPQNVMISFDGHVKVVDFGVAKSRMEFGGTQVGQFKGKVPYMAPEQASPGAEIDCRTDVFAMGILLFRLTVGKHPFLGPTETVTLANIVTNEVIAPSEVVEGYPPELESIVLRCLQKSPELRFASMAELATALERVGAVLGEPVTEEHLGAVAKRHLAESRRRRREAMREAARSLGWAVATSESHPRVSIPSNLGPGSLTPSGIRPESFTPSTRSNLAVGDVGPSTVRSVAAPKRRIAMAIAMFSMAAIAGSILGLVLLGTPKPASEVASASSAASTVNESPTLSDPAIVAPPAPTPTAEPSAIAASATTSAEHPSPVRPAVPPRPRPTATSWGAGPDMGF